MSEDDFQKIAKATDYGVSTVLVAAKRVSPEDATPIVAGAAMALARFAIEQLGIPTVRDLNAVLIPSLNAAGEQVLAGRAGTPSEPAPEASNEPRSRGH